MQGNQPKIHIIASCTNGKRKPVSLELASIPSSSLEKRVTCWWEKLSNISASNLTNKTLFPGNVGKFKAADLYIGNYWSNIRRLITESRLAGFETNLWIVSAGYGLISSEEEIFSYSATFTSGDKNSIDNKKFNSKRHEILNNWWELISNCSIPNSSHPRKLTELFSKNPSDFFLVIASNDYLSAIKNDLLDAIKSLVSSENLLIITSKSFSDITLQGNLIPADARIQCNGNCREDCKKHLIPKGIRGAISAALAIKIIEKIKEDGFVASKLKQFVENRIEKSPELINYNRVKLADHEVCSFISEELKLAPLASCSSLLRKLRNNNRACEQKRFRDLYWTIKRSKL